MPDHRKILLVEDHYDIRRALVILLRRAGYTVIEASSVAEGVAGVDGQAFALLDLFLLDGSGVDVLKEIRKAQILHLRHCFANSRVPGNRYRIRGCPDRARNFGKWAVRQLCEQRIHGGMSV